MSLRTVVGRVRKIDGTPWAYAPVIFRLAPGSYDSLIQYPGQSQHISTDINGAFQAQLWVNEEGESASEYICVLPSKEMFKFVLPPGISPIEISLLRTAGITPGSPQYKTLLTLISQIRTKINFSFGDASPKLIAEPLTKVHRVSIFIEIPFNGTPMLSLGYNGDFQGLVKSEFIDTNTAAEYSFSPNKIFTAPTQILLTISLGSGVTQGQGTIYLEN